MNTYSIKDGRTVSITQPTEDDAADIINYSKLIFSSTDQVLTTPEEYTITVEYEKNWINNFHQNPNALLLIARANTEITGLLFFVANTKKKNLHTGEFGLSVHPRWQGLGIGRLLIKTLLTWASAHAQIEKVYLHVFATNQHAIKLYESMRFTQEGRQVKAIKQLTGEYVDVIQMYIETK